MSDGSDSLSGPGALTLEHEGRREIADMLKAGPLEAPAIQEGLTKRQPLDWVNYHVGVLVHHKVVCRRSDGRYELLASDAPS